ncbi:hypothetical protein [Streptomyces sp. SID10815]|uniref:hypothetical protein n=1 Tax=Streptomyces sp. SID10815 TaxID=2706027 RepID=UPI0013C634EF|nr:hypothetical protein [Streptomyces sp. SID10815]NEA46815.1 hypothetical protein [Streptomyces sp. SID10815]
MTDPTHPGSGVRFTGAMALSDPRPSDPPPLIEALTVWGWVVEHGGVPLSYAARVLCDHPYYVRFSGVDSPTRAERIRWALDNLKDWENIVVQMDWPGDDAFDEERWDQDAYWRLRERLLRDTGRTESSETTAELLQNHLDNRIAECERQQSNRPDDHRS